MWRSRMPNRQLQGTAASMACSSLADWAATAPELHRSAHSRSGPSLRDSWSMRRDRVSRRATSMHATTFIAVLTLLLTLAAPLAAKAQEAGKVARTRHADELAVRFRPPYPGVQARTPRAWLCRRAKHHHRVPGPRRRLGPPQGGRYHREQPRSRGAPGKRRPPSLSSCRLSPTPYGSVSSRASRDRAEMPPGSQRQNRRVAREVDRTGERNSSEGLSRSCPLSPYVRRGRPVESLGGRRSIPGRAPSGAERGTPG